MLAAPCAIKHAGKQVIKSKGKRADHFTALRLSGASRLYSGSERATASDCQDGCDRSRTSSGRSEPGVSVNGQG